MTPERRAELRKTTTMAVPTGIMFELLDLLDAAEREATRLREECARANEYANSTTEETLIVRGECEAAEAERLRDEEHWKKRVAELMAAHDALAARVHAIADENGGPHPVQSVEESLTCIEAEFHRRHAEAARREMRVAELEAFGEKVNAIRNSIVGAQVLNFSEHVYPLVAVLDAAGFVGLGYSEARANPATLVARVRELEAALRSYLMAHPIRCSCAGCKALEGGK